MSELSKLIEINQNIEKQNEEIIRLLKKIAGEDSDMNQSDDIHQKGVFEEIKKVMAEIPAKEPVNKSVLEYMPDFGELYPEEDAEIEKEPQSPSLRIGSLLDTSIGIGEVYFIEGQDIFKLSIENNETRIDNLTGDSQPNEFALQEMVANESIKNNVSLLDGSVILSREQCANLPEIMRVCIEQGAQKIYMPLSASAQLIGAPQNLIEYVSMDFYKNNDNLLEKLF